MIIWVCPHCKQKHEEQIWQLNNLASNGFHSWNKFTDACASFYCPTAREYYYVILNALGCLGCEIVETLCLDYIKTVAFDEVHL